MTWQNPNLPAPVTTLPLTAPTFPCEIACSIARLAGALPDATYSRMALAVVHVPAGWFQ